MVSSLTGASSSRRLAKASSPPYQRHVDLAKENAILSWAGNGENLCLFVVMPNWGTIELPFGAAEADGVIDAMLFLECAHIYI